MFCTTAATTTTTTGTTASAAAAVTAIAAATTILLCYEVIVKLYVLKPGVYFCGPIGRWNVFDLALSGILV